MGLFIRDLKGYGFIEFGSSTEANEVIEKCQKLKIGDRYVKVSVSYNGPPEKKQYKSNDLDESKHLRRTESEGKNKNHEEKKHHSESENDSKHERPEIENAEQRQKSIDSHESSKKDISSNRKKKYSDSPPPRRSHKDYHRHYNVDDNHHSSRQHEYSKHSRRHPSEYEDDVRYSRKIPLNYRRDSYHGQQDLLKKSRYIAPSDYRPHPSARNYPNEQRYNYKDYPYDHHSGENYNDVETKKYDRHYERHRKRVRTPDRSEHSEYSKDDNYPRIEYKRKPYYDNRFYK